MNLKQNLLDNFRQIYKLLLGIFIFTIPSNLFYKFGINNGYANGILVDYLIPKIYLTDLVALIIILILVIEKVLKRKDLQKKKTKGKSKNRFNQLKWLFLALVITFFIRQFFSINQIGALINLIKLTEIFILIKLTKIHKKILPPVFLFGIIAATLIFQSSLAIFQFHSQSSLGGFNFLGEVDYSKPFFLAKTTIGEQLRVLPYGTTTHPNVLAGFIVVFWLSLWQLFVKKIKETNLNFTNSFIFTSASIVSMIALFLTQSISGWLALLMGLILFSIKKIKQHMVLLTIITVFIITPFVINIFAIKFPNNLSLTRRNTLNKAAWEMFVDNPLFGVGLNNFTVNLEKYSSSKEIIRFVQPVHHIGLLWLSETGINGLLLVVLGYLSITKHIPKKKRKETRILLWVLILTPIMVLDHYFLTQQSGLLLILFIFLISTFKQKNCSIYCSS